MTNNSDNRKVKYTKMVLRDSLLKLMATKPINKITVTEICKLADINRGTFYLHYLDVYDLLEKIHAELFQEINSAIEKLVLDNFASNVILQEIFQVIKDNGDLCKIIFSKNGDKNFLKKILILVKEKILLEWSSSYKLTSMKNLEYLYVFVFNGTVGIIEEWLHKGLKESPQEISQLVDIVTNASIDTIIKINKI